MPPAQRRNRDSETIIALTNDGIDELNRMPDVSPNPEQLSRKLADDAPHKQPDLPTGNHGYRLRRKIFTTKTLSNNTNPINDQK